MKNEVVQKKTGTKKRNIGKFKYDSIDEIINGIYKRKVNSIISVEIQKLGGNIKNSHIVDKNNKYVYDGYTLRIRISDCPSTDKLQYMFNAFKEFYCDGNDYLSLISDMTEEFGHEFFQLEIGFTLYNDIVTLEEIDTKIEEVKLEIEGVIRIFEIYDYEVKFKFYAFEPTLKNDDDLIIAV